MKAQRSSSDELDRYDTESSEKVTEKQEFSLPLEVKWKALKSDAL